MSYRLRVTPWRVLSGPKGDVCPQPAMIAGTQHLGRNATAAGAAVLDGGQGGRQAFAVDRREVPT